MSNVQQSSNTQQQRPTGKEIVYVGCKLPHGLVLELVKPGKDWKPNPTDLKGRVTLKGANNVRDPGLMGASQPEHPFSLTAVDASFWAAWYADNKDLAFVQNGQIFAVPVKGTDTEAKKSAKAEATEKMPVKTGLEALNPATDERGRAKDERLKSIAVKGRGETQIQSDPDQLSRLMAGMMDAA